MALPPFGVLLKVVGAARALRLMTTFESGLKKTSKAVVAIAEKSQQAAMMQEQFARGQEAGIEVAKNQRDELRLLKTEMASMRAEQALATAEAGRYARQLALVSVALGVASVALTKFTSANLKAALGAEKSSIALEVLTENMNLNREATAAEIAELRERNLTLTEAERTVARFAKAELDIAQASDLALAVMRLSTLSTISYARAMELATDAIVRRRLRQLQALEVGIKYNEAIEDSAKLLEVEGKHLTDSERSQAILNVILREGNKLRGVENAYLETGTALLDSYHTQVKDLQRTLGDVLLPSYIEILKAGNDFLEWLNGLPKPMKDAISYFSALATAIVGVSTSIVGALALLKMGGFATGAFAASITAALPTIGLVVAALAAVAGIALLTYKAIKTLRGPIDEATKMMEDFYKITVPFADEKTRRRAAELFVGAFRKIFGEVEDEAAQAGARVGRAFIDAVIAEIKERGSRIEADLTRLGKAFEKERLEAELILIPLRMREKLIQRAIVLEQRRADAAEKVAEEPLKAAQEQLEGLANISKELDKVLLPYELALRRVEASAGRILILLRAQERSLQRQLDLLQRRIALERRSLELVLKAAELSLRGIEDQIYALDKALWPLQDALTQISADTDLVLIPLRRQRREIERQIERMERLSEIEQERIERHLRALEKQRDALQDIIDADRKRLDIINHEIFMEQQRNRILQRVTSARFLTMESQAAVMQDQLALRQEDMKALNKQIRDERERLRDLRDILDEQLEPLRERLQILVDAITLEEDRVTFARENLRLEEARQTAARIALEQQRRLAEEEVEQAQRRLDAFDELAEARVQALEDELTAVGDLIAKEEERIEQVRDALELAKLEQTEGRIALENMISLWEDIRDEAEAYAEVVKKENDSRMETVKNILTRIQDIITEKELELAWTTAIKDEREATLKLEKLSLETVKKKLDVLEKIHELISLVPTLQGGTTGGVTTEPTVPAPSPVPTPPVIILPSGTPEPKNIINLDAHYSNTQSPATIVDDVELMLAYAR